MMRVGTLEVVLRIAGAASLKDKRQVVRSLVTTARNKFNISVAEVDDLDNWKQATIGVACVSNDIQHVNEVLDKVHNHLCSCPEAEVIDSALDLD